MATQETDAPHAHQGPHYANPQTKPLLGPAPKTDRGAVQRLVWPLFFVLVLGGIAIAAALGLVGGQ